MKRNKYTSFIISSFLCTSFTCAFIISNDISNLKGEQLNKVLSDSFSIPGILCLCIYILLKVSDTGFFYSISYCIKFAFSMLIPFATNNKKQSYIQYLNSIEKKERIFDIYPLIVSVIFIAIGCFFIFYKV